MGRALGPGDIAALDDVAAFVDVVAVKVVGRVGLLLHESYARLGRQLVGAVEEGICAGDGQEDGWEVPKKTHGVYRAES